MDSFKKILVISNNAVSNTNNNGKTLNSFFKEWPSENIAQLYFNREIPVSKNILNTYRLDELDVVNYFLFRKQSMLGSKMNSTSSPTIPIKFLKVLSFGSFFSKIMPKIMPIMNRRLESVKLYLRDIVLQFGIRKSIKLEQWLTSFAPEAIFVVTGDSCFTIDLAIKLSDKKIPLYTYTTDDYLFYRDISGPFGGLYKQKLIKKYDSILSISACAFFIGHKMSNTFIKKFNITSNTEVLINTVEGSSKSIREKENYVRILYAGGMHLGRGKSLVAFAELIDDINKDYNLNCILDIYCHQDVDPGIINGIEKAKASFKGAVEWHELKNRISNSDILLHIESFDSEFSSKTKLSVSTKIPEYLQSCRCLLAVGPSDIASIELIEKNEVGLVITEKDSEKSKIEKIVSILTNDTLRNEIALRGFDFANKEFNPIVIRNKLLKIINQ